MTRKLYLVTLEYEIPVYARNRADAIDEALAAVNDEDPVERAIEVKDREHAQRLGLDLGALPWGDSGDWTVGDVLDGLPDAPEPPAPASLGEIGDWVSLRSHSDSRDLIERETGEGRGCRWWINGYGVLATVADTPDEHPSMDRIVGLLTAPKEHCGTVALPDLDGLCDGVQRGIVKPIMIGDVLLDARIVRRWAWGAAHAAGDETITVEWSGELDPVRFSGAGWAAIVMPIRPDGSEAGRAARVPVEVNER